MKSRITIEVDFDNANVPVIKIVQQDSDDVRDSLIKSFIQSFQHTSRWCKIIYKGEHGSTSMNPVDGANISRKWHVVPITPQQLEEEIKLMQAVMEEKWHMVK